MASDAVNRKFAVGRDNAGNGAKQPHLLSEAEASALRSAHDRSDGMMLWSYDFSSKKLRIYGVVPQKILHQGVAPSNSFAVRRALGKVGFKAISAQIKALSAANSHGGCYFSLVAGSEINDFYFRAYAGFDPAGKMVGLSGTITYLERLVDQQTNQSSEFFLNHYLGRPILLTGVGIPRPTKWIMTVNGTTELLWLVATGRP